LRRLAEGPRLAALANCLFSRGAAFHMSLIQLSERGSGQGTAWHQDVDPENHTGALYNFLIYPEDLTIETGPLVYVPGSHLRGLLPPGDHYAHLEGQRTLLARAGDLAIVHGTLFHSVPRNQTQRRRFSINFRFRDATVPGETMSVGVYRNGRFDYATGAAVLPDESLTAAAPSPATPLPSQSVMERLLELERAHLTTGMTPGFLAAPRVFTHGRGVRLYDLDGRQYYDFSAGTFTNATGHCHPRVVSFMQERVAELWNIHDYASRYREPLLRQLHGLTPSPIDTFEFYSGGSETIEAGLRALRSYLPEGRKGICAFKQGYHGKTLGSRSLVGLPMLGEPADPMTVLEFPNCYRCPFGKLPSSCNKECFEHAEETIEHSPELGALVLEPILGAAGVISPPAGYLERLQELCRKHDILLFLDEICVGFGRTGRDFAFQHFGLEPDLIAFAKGLASGFPAMVLGGRRDIMTRAPFGSPGGASTTFGGNPLAVAAMHVTLDVYRDERLCENAAALEAVLAERLAELAERHPVVGEARVRGLFACLDFVKDRKTKEPNDAFGLELHRRCMALGLKTFAFGHIFRIAPPLTITEAELHAGLDRVSRALSQVAAKAA
jgi:4-aminobutyrate aminotransferase-like enzyme